MKTILFTIVLVIITNGIFAQYRMIVKKTDNSILDILIEDIDEITFPYGTCPGIPTVDYEGITYNTVQIGTQCWLKENLNIGTKINGGVEQTNNSIIEKYCYNNTQANCTTYGGLYQWAEAVQYQNGATNTTSPSPAFTGNVQGICPTGWHIPKKTEFQTLKSTVGNISNALKAIGQGTGSGAGTNTSGFSALLAGYRTSSGGFSDLGKYTDIWSTTVINPTNVYDLELYYSDNGVYYASYGKVNGLSVRCVKD
ncbi:MAG: FISUMP domain-containing protein [bacterium]